MTVERGGGKDSKGDGKGDGKDGKGEGKDGRENGKDGKESLCYNSPGRKLDAGFIPTFWRCP